MFETVTLSSVCTIVKQSPPQFDGYKQYVATADLQKSNIISSTKVTYENRPSRADSTVNLGDVLFAKMAGTEKTLIAKREHQDMLFSTGFAILRPIPDTLDSAYLYHILRSEKFLLQKDRMSSGATQKAITNKALLKIKIALPPIKEQIRIAAIFDKADEILQTSLTTKVKRDEMIYSTFLNMFGDPFTNPKGWHIKTLGDLFTALPKLGTMKPAHQDGIFPIIRVGQLGDINPPLEMCGKITLEENEIIKFGCLENDVLLARAIGSQSHLGKASIVKKSDTPIIFDSHVMRLRFNDELVDSMFFYYWLKSKGGRTRFLQEARNTAVQFNINGTQIKRVKLPLPPIELQHQFVEIMNRILDLGVQIDFAEEVTLSLTQELLT